MVTKHFKQPIKMDVTYPALCRHFHFELKVIELPDQESGIIVRVDTPHVLRLRHVNTGDLSKFHNLHILMYISLLYYQISLS